jgi:hypothetical protein
VASRVVRNAAARIGMRWAKNFDAKRSILLIGGGWGLRLLQAIPFHSRNARIGGEYISVKLNCC